VEFATQLHVSINSVAGYAAWRGRMVILCRQEPHSEATPNGIVQLIQVVRALPRATQTFVRVAAEPVLRAQDEFDCAHRPRVGPFSPPLPGGTGRGELFHPGQSFVRINGKLAATRAGTNRACSEGIPTLSNRDGAFFTKRPFLSVNGETVFTGRS
jgi:uncharacterized Zn-binding protein involved in type VI secretion